MSKKLLCTTLAALMLTSVFAGCSKPNEPSGGDQTSGSSDQNVTLKYWAYSRWEGVTGKEENGEFGDWQRSVAKAYTDKNPNVKIEFEHLPWNGGPEKVEVAIASKTQPDVLEDGTLRGFGYAGQGVLLNFDDSLTAEELADIPESEWKQVEYKGKHIAMPWANMPGHMLINKTLFEKAGALNLLPQNPEKSWTFDEFEKAVAAVSKNGSYGMALFAGNEQGDAQAMNYMRGFGASILSPDGMKATLNSPEGIKATSWLLSMMDKGYAMPGAESIKNPDVLDYFYQGKVAIIAGAGGANYNLAKAAMDKGDVQPFDITWAQTPTDGTHAGGFNANPVCVMAFKSGDTNREKTAIDFTKFVTSGENAKAVKYGSLMPTRKSAGNLYEGNELLTWQATIMKNAVDPGFASPAYTQIRAVLYPELQALYTKSKTADKVVADFDAKAQSEIDKAAAKK